MKRYQAFVKRIIDVVVSLIMFILYIPILIIIAPLIKMDSRGPVLFIQKSIGKGEKLFTIYKLKTMYVNAPDIRMAKEGRILVEKRFSIEMMLDETMKVYSNLIKQKLIRLSTVTGKIVGS